MSAEFERPKQEITILLAEDDSGHARLIEKNLHRAGITNHIDRVENGADAMDYLIAKREATTPGKSIPVLVLLDLSMPVMDGYQVLQQMKQDEHLKSIPVIVLTTTDDPREVNRCYELGCNVYVTKPVEYDAFCDAIRKLGLFLSVVTIPHWSKQT